MEACGMAHQPSLISIEFNELCPNLMSRFMKAGELPHFQRFHDQAMVFETDAEEKGQLLNPWVQWISVHTGLSASEHQVTTLSEGHRVAAPAIWDVVSNAGMPVWVCGSMNARYDQPLNGHLLPDPWSTGCRAYPAGEFDRYLDYVRLAVQEHTGGGGRGGIKPFLRYMLGHGLSASTVLSVAGHLASERFANRRWRRARMLDLFQWDLFRHYYRQIKPRLATFFLNSTAHFQHCYWRYMEPEKFQCKPSEAEQKDYGRAILFGYKCMDQLIGRFMRLADKDTTLIFSTALSQQPYLDHEETSGRHYYHLRDQSKLTSPLGLEGGFTYEPVMAEQFYLRFGSESETDRAEAKLHGYHVKHPAVFKDERTRMFHMTRKDRALMVQCRCTAEVPSDACITASDDPELSIPFHDVFYHMPATKSGRHHQAGMLWIRRPDRRRQVHAEPVSIRSIAPTVMRLFGLPVPQHMRAEPLDAVIACGNRGQGARTAAAGIG
jgi:hypothetical protein